MPFVQSLACPFVRRIVARHIAVGLISATLALSQAPSASAQAVPHLSVSTTAYHTLVAPGTLITASMCKMGSAFCLAAIGKPLVSDSPNGRSFATDQVGNIYVIDLNNEILFKIAPGGQITILAGEYGQTSPTYAPLSAPAASSALSLPYSPAVDAAGNIFLGVDSGQISSSGDLASILKIDTEGIAHRITAPQPLATPKPVEGALASSQFVDPTFIATGPNGDVYLTDQITCTVRVLSAKDGTLHTVVGSLTGGCDPKSTPVAGEKASSINLPVGIVPIAVGADGTIYLAEQSNIYSVTTDGIYHLLARGGLSTPFAPFESIGFPVGPLVIDPAGNLYFNSVGEIPAPSSNQAPLSYFTNLVEVTKGTSASPSQILFLAGSQPGGTLEGLNPEGMPSNLSLISGDSIAIDAAGRLITTTPEINNVFGIAYFDRNGSIIFNNAQTDTKDFPALPQTITLTNSGNAPLHTVNIAGTGYPYYLLPTAAELKAANISGPVPFSIDQKTSTCFALVSAGVLTLQPGQSCTLTFDSTSNADVFPAGSFTLYTNDPRGPLTVALNAYPLNGNATSIDGNYLGITSYAVQLSSTQIAPASLTSNGSFTVAAAVASSTYHSQDINGSYYEIETQVIPTGRIFAAVSNNATGAVTGTPFNTLDADGKTTFTFTGLAPGTYTLEAVYLGDGKSAASFSAVQTLTVTKPD